LSTHAVNIIEIREVLPHTNAERLELVPVGQWQAVVKKGDFKPGDRAVYIEPDYMVPTSLPEFAFLAKEGRSLHRLRAIKLRGVVSYGLLIPLPKHFESFPVGENIMTDMGIERYEPEIHAPSTRIPAADELPRSEWPLLGQKFDLEAFQKFATVIQPGEDVIVTEKIHGANARYLFSNGVFYIGTRTRWLKPDVDPASSAWHAAVWNDPYIRGWCEGHPDVVLYGEVYGPVQSLKYGSDSRVRFAAFAAQNADGSWWSLLDLWASGFLMMAPLLYHGPFDPDVIFPLAEQDSSIATAPPGHMREGIVIVPAKERHERNLGRVALKHISNRYWLSDAA